MATVPIKCGPVVLHETEEDGDLYWAGELGSVRVEMSQVFGGFVVGDISVTASQAPCIFYARGNTPQEVANTLAKFLGELHQATKGFS
jgi:hypothetical protein